ncbi:lytic transglycosylase domain-containing protein [Paraflavisolibacter sp. H34]|uniref:lytic transglycosylase domain-containing protein n=1 Tax=Huijunlia imazamoxiresistens TaxID=3127457 RepID=UPI00301B2F51
MKKLLLLTISMVSFFLKDYAADTGPGRTGYSLTISDTLIKGAVPADPKDGFKNLFVKSASSPGFAIAKLNPLAISFVQDYMERFGSNLNKMKNWGKPYFDLMNDVLAQHGIPIEMKYLSVIESALKNYAVSWAGAVGPWQFMPATARNLGLRVSGTTDERTDFYKSTHAAARYLTQLFGMYGDWLLVIAAYNCGPGVVNSAIKKSGSRNFWTLERYLPAESRMHVKKFIATHYIMEGNGGITTVTKKDAEDLMLNTPASADAVSAIAAAQAKGTHPEIMNVSGKYNSAIIAQTVQMTPAEFNRLNPNFDKQLAANGSVDLRLPADKMLLFQANKPQILEKSIMLMLASDGR